MRTRSLVRLLLTMGLIVRSPQRRGPPCADNAVRPDHGDHGDGRRHRSTSSGNLHAARLYLGVDNQGTIEKWLAEGGSRTQLMRVGWTGEEVKPGDKVTVRGHPPRDASAKLIHMEYLTLPDGTERFAEDIRYDQFNERRRRPAE
jgi:hypothetical protein